ncbi:MAG TPA: hypothetical protein VHU40_11685 [Polyangia bacterium]|nr:hypothetical protein [Polyangia bacterium]
MGLTLAASPAMAQKNKKSAPAEAGTDKSIEKQSAWEQKVMGEDSAKKADAKKIANAQRLAEEARKNPPPEPVAHHKDPNKEGVRAKREASIGLPIESEQEQKAAPKKVAAAKKAETSGPANDELGALVAASLADEKKQSGGATASNDVGAHGKGRKAKGRETAAKSAEPSSLDRMFAGGK